MEYSSTGQLISEVHYDADGVIYNQLYFYDEKGNLIKTLADRDGIGPDPIIVNEEYI